MKYIGIIFKLRGIRINGFQDIVVKVAQKTSGLESKVDLSSWEINPYKIGVTSFTYPQF